MTRKPRPTLLALVLAACVAMASLPGLAQEAPPPPEFSKDFRKKAGKVQKAVDAKDWESVLAGLPELEAIEEPTRDDLRFIAIWRLSAVQASGDREAFAQVIEQFMADGFAVPGQIGPMHQQLAAHYNGKQDMPKTLYHYQRFIEATDAPGAEELETMGRLFLQQEQFSPAADWLGRAIARARADGQQPKELWYQLRDRCFVELADSTRRLDNLEALSRYYPNKEYYSRILAIYAKSSNDDRTVMLNAYRAALTDAGLATVGEYLAYADTALVAGSPGEALRALEHGMAAGIVPTVGSNAVALQEAKAAVAADRRSLMSDAASAARNSKGEVDVKVGLGFYSLGEYAKSEELVRRGLAKGGVKRLDEAQLLLGAALMGLNRYDEARIAFTVAATAAGEGSLMARIAGLWLGMIERRAVPVPATAPAEAAG